MDDDKTDLPPSAFDGDEPPHTGAEEDRDRPANEDLSTEDLAEGGPAGA